MEIISQTKPCSRNVAFIVAFDADTAEPLIWGPDGSSAVAYVNQAKVRSGPRVPSSVLGNCPLYRLESTNKRKLFPLCAPNSVAEVVIARAEERTHSAAATSRRLCAKLGPHRQMSGCPLSLFGTPTSDSSHRPHSRRATSTIRHHITPGQILPESRPVTTNLGNPITSDQIMQPPAAKAALARWEESPQLVRANTEVPSVIA